MGDYTHLAIPGLFSGLQEPKSKTVSVLTEVFVSAVARVFT